MISRYAIALSLVLLLACSAQPAHASLSTDTTRVVYAGSGSTGPFPVTFPFTADADLLVIKTDTPAYITSTVLALNTDYTVTGAGGTGGTVMLTSTLTSAYTLVIMRASDFLQSSAFGEHQPFHAASIEAILDKHTKELQELQDKVDRSLRVSPANSGTYSLEHGQTYSILRPRVGFYREGNHAIPFLWRNRRWWEYRRLLLLDSRLWG